ncbi:Gti1/Pac2 family-domain-containing protein, partial [Lentinula lateritia]
MSTSSASHQPPPTTWNEPPWTGWIETTGDALLILEAARRGWIPRVTRRLVDSERKMITSGSVFVFDEEESGIKRWTDGFFWSPSRILGNFLLYRETDKRGPGHKGARPQEEAAEVPDASPSSETHSLSRPKSETSNNHLGFDKLRERSLMGSLTNSYKFKSNGLMKKTFSLSIGGVAQHLISYYRIEDVENGRLRSPSSLPELASLDISPEYLDKTHFRNPPKVEVGPDGVPRYRGEADDIEAVSTSSIISAPLSTGLPLLTDGRVTDIPKRPNKRFEPYSTAAQPAAKRQRKR